MHEYSFIDSILKLREQSNLQLNAPFTSDAEIIKTGDSKWAITVDDFSELEDFYSNTPPGVIGWNMAVATLSDVLVCGINPQFFLQSIVISNRYDQAYYDALIKGVLDALGQCNCHLLGGDTGSADEWRYNGIALGQLKKLDRAVSRIIDVPEKLDIYISGELGDVNAAVLNHATIPRFELRLQESDLIQRYASAAIDTSSGFIDALWLLKGNNPGYDFEIDLVSIPYAESVIDTMEKHKLPQELTLIGGAGEYEFLTLVPEDFYHKIECKECFTKIGTVTPVKETGKVVFSEKGTVCGSLEISPPCYRSCKPEDYVKQTLDCFQHIFSS